MLRKGLVLISRILQDFYQVVEDMRAKSPPESVVHEAEAEIAELVELQVPVMKIFQLLRISPTVSIQAYFGHVNHNQECFLEAGVKINVKLGRNAVDVDCILVVLKNLKANQFVDLIPYCDGDFRLVISYFYGVIPFLIGTRQESVSETGGEAGDINGDFLRIWCAFCLNDELVAFFLNLQFIPLPDVELLRPFPRQRDELRAVGHLDDSPFDGSTPDL